jgi:hypothetical protein
MSKLINMTKMSNGPKRVGTTKYGNTIDGVF